MQKKKKVTAKKKGTKKCPRNGSGLEGGRAGGSRILPLCEQVSPPWFLIFDAVSDSGGLETPYNGEDDSDDSELMTLI